MLFLIYWNYLLSFMFLLKKNMTYFSYIHLLHKKVVNAVVPSTVIEIAFPWYLFFSIEVFFHDRSRVTGLEEKGEGISLTPHYHHFYPLHRHLDIIRAITVESSRLHIGSSWTRTGNLWFEWFAILTLNMAV